MTIHLWNLEMNDFFKTEYFVSKWLIKIESRGDKSEFKGNIERWLTKMRMLFRACIAA